MAITKVAATGLPQRVAGSKLARSAEESGSSPAPARLAVALVEDAAAVLGSLLVLRRSSKG